MPRLTKTDIEQELLAGKPVTWRDTASKSASIILETPKQRRLFEFLLRSQVREAKALPATFVDGLSAAYGGIGDPATALAARATGSVGSGPWKIHALEIQGFGGVNLAKGKSFDLRLEIAKVF